MKKLTCLILLVAALFSASCSKKPLCCISPEPPVMTAQKNGADWLMPIIKSTVSKTNNIFISTVGPQLLNTTTDSLAISLQYTGIGSYTPTDANVAYTVFSNGVKTTCTLDQTYANRIDITEFTLPQNEPVMTSDPTEMKATFNLRFTNPQHTTTITFLNGKITAHLAN
jgi:hypothetical protein